MYPHLTVIERLKTILFIDNLALQTYEARQRMYQLAYVHILQINRVSFHECILTSAEKHSSSQIALEESDAIPIERTYPEYERVIDFLIECQSLYIEICNNNLKERKSEVI